MADDLTTMPDLALVVRETPREVAEALVAVWRALAAEAVAARGIFVAALSGGSTPESFYRRLAAEPGLPWDATHLFLADERLVAAGAPESNERLVRRALVERLERKPAGLHLPGESARAAGDERVAASCYEDGLRAFFSAVGEPEPVFDLVLLGLGEDGHTASLFPGAAALEERGRCVAGVPATASRLARVSLTLPCIARARQVYFLVTGEGKRRALAGLIAGDARLPAARVRLSRGVIFVYADRAAAGAARGGP